MSHTVAGRRCFGPEPMLSVAVRASRWVMRMSSAGRRPACSIYASTLRKPEPTAWVTAPITIYEV